MTHNYELPYHFPRVREEVLMLERFNIGMFLAMWHIVLPYKHWSCSPCNYSNRVGSDPHVIISFRGASSA